MRIALCLCGVVGNIYINKADYVWQGEADYRLGREYYERRLFAVNDAQIDVFMHSWSTDYAEQLIRDYRPKRWQFESQIDFGQPDRARNFNRSRWYSTRASVALKRAYEREQGFEYDWVVLARYDLALFKDLVLARYDPEFFYPGHHDWQSETLFVREEPMYCDFFYVANSTKMDAFSRLYDDLAQIKVDNAHAQSLIHAKRLDFRLRSDFMLGRDFSLMRYVYVDPRFRGDDYPGEAGFERTPAFPRASFGLESSTARTHE
jgi:hypothetical protein